MSTTVRAERFDSHGRVIEWVYLTVNIPREATGEIDTVYLHIEGRGPAKQFAIPIANWRELNRAVPDEPDMQSVSDAPSA